MTESAATPVETTWWSKFFVFSAVLCLILLISGPFGYKYEITGLGPSLISILVAVVGAVLVFVIGLVMMLVAIKKDLPKDRNLILVAMVLSLIPMMFVVPQMLKAQSVPAIHDISTDTTNPPEFVTLVEARSDTDNDLVYEDATLGAETAMMQEKTYPNVKPLEADLSVEDAVARAAGILEEQGLAIANVDSETGIVEATATTAWFGFKDDVVVRVVAVGDVSRIDVRSVSRVGRSDIGANAARIEKFLAAFTSI